MSRPLTTQERQYIAYKKTKEYEYAAPYLPVGALERMAEDDLRSEVREILTEYLPEHERRELAQELSDAREQLFGDEHDLSPSEVTETP